jgi:hypothetical protein
MHVHQNLSRQEWVTRCAREIDVLIPLRRENPGLLSPAFLNDWAAAVWADCQGWEQPELAAWAAVKDAQKIWAEVIY